MSTPQWTNLVRAVLIGMALALPDVALADPKLECSEAYDSTQVLRDAGNIDAALVEADKCALETCAKFIRDDCTKWRDELQARQSTVIVVVVDTRGAPVREGSVTLDGSPWLDRLDGAAHALPKGPHALEISAKGAAIYPLSIDVKEGEKDRRLSFAITENEGAGPKWILVEGDRPPTRGDRRLLVPGIAAGVGGLALAVAGGVLLGFAAGKASAIVDLCGDSPPVCSGPPESSAQANDLAESGKPLEIAGGTLVAIGAAGLALGTTLMVIDAATGDAKGTKAKRASVVPGVWAARDTGGVWLHVAF